MQAMIDPGTRAYAVGADAGPAIWYVNNRAVILATAAQTGGAFGLIDMHVAVGHGPPLHIHHTEDEALWVVEGQLTVRCGDQLFTAGPGSFVFIPRGVPHTFRLDGNTSARLLVLVVPGGGEGYFIEAGRPAVGPGLPPPAPPDVAQLQAIAAKYDMAFVGPPLASAAGE